LADQDDDRGGHDGASPATITLTTDQGQTDQAQTDQAQTDQSNGQRNGYGNSQTDRYVSAPQSFAPANESPAAPSPQAQAPSQSAGEEVAVTPQEAPRRRSTIREPAPLASAGAPPPAVTPQPTPVVVSNAGEEPAPPKRGWWAKRLLGNKS
jgi:hypothetical protein